MKKFLSLLMTAMLILSSFSMVFASGEGGGFGGISINPDTSNSQAVAGIAGKIIGAIQVVGYLIAAGMIVFIGVKYIMASASEKAELKGLLIKYVIGALLIVFGVNVAEWVFAING